MTVKGSDGQTYHVTSQGQGNFNTVGAAGGIGWIAEKVFGGNFFGGGTNYGCSENTPVNRYELNLVSTIGAKDARIGLLESQVYTDQKLVETTAYLQGEIGKVAAKLEAFKDAQNAVNLQQATYNATATANIGCIGQQIAQLQSLSQLVVPQNKVCDTCCGCN